MSKHTPGPWEVVREDEHEWSIWHEYADDAGDKFRTWLADSIYSEADARLIAAAPDLYDSCIKAGSVLKTVLDEISDSAAKQVIERTLKKIAAAIAKAEGRS